MEFGRYIGKGGLFVPETFDPEEPSSMDWLDVSSNAWQINRTGARLGPALALDTVG
jgi:hypothetical protein